MMRWYFRLCYIIAICMIVYGIYSNNILFIGLGCLITPLMGLLVD